MAQIQTYECDICHVIKREVNHWWKGYKGLTTGKLSIDPQALIVVPHSTSLSIGILKPADLCGFDCVTKWLHQQMQEIINRENANRTAGSDKDKV